MKNWVDTVQWHLEDIIRDPQIDPVEALAIKRRIDKSNQVRTDMVEYIDSYLLDKYKAVVRSPTRVSIPKRRVGDRPAVDSGAENLPHASGDAAQRRGRGAPRRLPQKLDVLLSQQVDLSRAIEELIEDIEAGRKYMKTYKQMKMYNDPALNPVLYGAKK